MNRSVITVKIFFALALFVAAQARANANELQSETVKAWDEYIRTADLQMKDRLERRTSFLWMDESADHRQRIDRGEILVAPIVSQGTRRVPGGLIHHWIGAVFIPGATIDSLSTVMRNYNAYKDFYKPVVVDSKVLDCTATEQKFWMRWRHEVLFVTAAMEGVYESHHIMLDSRRGYNVSDSIRLQEIENYGRAGQRLLPPETGDGYIWRMYSISRYEQRNGGVSLEVEAMVLTRDIPTSVQWLVSPIVNHLSRNSLMTTLQQTRDAVKSPLPNTGTVSMCSN